VTERPAGGTIPRHALAVLDHVRAHPRMGWFITDLLPDGSEALPPGYPTGRRSLERALTTLVARGLASREALAWSTRGRAIEVGGRNPTYVYFFPGMLPGKAIPLQILLATDPASIAQTLNVRRWLPTNPQTGAGVVEYIEVELVTPDGRGPVNGRTLDALLRATFPSLIAALKSVQQPALLFARIGQSGPIPKGPGRTRTHRAPVPTVRMPIARLAQLGKIPKKSEGSGRNQVKV
jgi:hypothetical protein